MTRLIDATYNATAKPLFVPLASDPYDSFEAGNKTVEVRQYGPRWNARTVKPGRPAILSKGYGKKNRLARTVRRVVVVDRFADLPTWAKEGSAIVALNAAYFDPARPIIAFEAT